jgi:hypothetical protein
MRYSLHVRRSICVLLGLVGCDDVFDIEPIGPDNGTMGGGYLKSIVITQPTQTTLSAFPVSVALAADSDLAAHAKRNEIGFLDASGAPLACEIAAFDETTGALDAWVLMPQLPPDSVWIRLTDDARLLRRPAIPRRWQSNEPRLQLRARYGQWRSNVSDGAHFVVLALNLISPVDEYNTWLHLAAVVDRAVPEMRVYVNGVEKDAMPLTGWGSLTGTSALGLGAPSALVVGVLDEARVYATAISPAWLEAEYTNLALRDSFITVEAERVP